MAAGALTPTRPAALQVLCGTRLRSRINYPRQRSKSCFTKDLACDWSSHEGLGALAPQALILSKAGRRALAKPPAQKHGPRPYKATTFGLRCNWFAVWVRRRTTVSDTIGVSTFST